MTSGSVVTANVAAMLSLAGADAGLFLAGTRGQARMAPPAGPAVLSSPGDEA